MARGLPEIRLAARRWPPWQNVCFRMVAVPHFLSGQLFSSCLKGWSMQDQAQTSSSKRLQKPSSFTLYTSAFVWRLGKIGSSYRKTTSRLSTLSSSCIILSYSFLWVSCSILIHILTQVCCHPYLEA
jgi:hypothetical protein